MADAARLSLADIPRVADGVFFSFAPPLPRGRHRMSRAEVRIAQRERMMVAFTELVAARGYAAVTVAEVVARAGVSRAPFYECFDGKEGCAIACYRRYTDVLLARQAASLAANEEPRRWIVSILEAYLGALQADLVAARAFHIELDAAGAPLRRLRRETLSRFADAIYERYEAFRASGGRIGYLPRSAHLAGVYAIRQLACDALEDSDSPDLNEIVAETMRWIGARDAGAALVETQPDSG
jgi:AcrR family transcriptional regulator